MRKLLFLLPLLWASAPAGAAHGVPLEAAAYRLDASANLFYRQVAPLRGNRHLKAEARRFALQSERFARQVRRNPGRRHLAVSLYRLDGAFYALWSAVEDAGVRVNQRKLRKRFLSLARALDTVQLSAAKKVRRASARSRGAYIAWTDPYGRHRAHRRYGQ